MTNFIGNFQVTSDTMMESLPVVECAEWQGIIYINMHEATRIQQRM